MLPSPHIKLRISSFCSTAHDMARLFSVAESKNISLEKLADIGKVVKCESPRTEDSDGWKKLGMSRDEVDLNFTLPTGQTFR